MSLIAQCHTTMNAYYFPCSINDVDKFIHKAKHVKGVSVGIGGYLDWMKRSASFIYPVTIMGSRSFVNGD